MASSLPVRSQPETVDYRAFYRFVDSCKEEMEKHQTGFRQCPMRSAKLHRLCLDKWSELSWDEKKGFYPEEEVEMAQAVGKKPNKKATKDRNRRVDAAARGNEDAPLHGSVKGPPIKIVAEGEYRMEDDLVIAKRSEEDDHLADAVENMEVDEGKGDGGSGKKSKVAPKADKARVEDGGADAEREKIVGKGLKATRGKNRSKAKLEQVIEDQRDSADGGSGRKKGRKGFNEKAESMTIEEDERGDAMEIDDPGEKTGEKLEKGSKRGRKAAKGSVETDEKGSGEKATKRGRPVKEDKEPRDVDDSKEKVQKKGKKVAKGPVENEDIDKAGAASKKGKKSSKHSVDQGDDGPEKREKVQRKVKKGCKELVNQVDEVPLGKGRK